MENVEIINIDDTDAILTCVTGYARYYIRQCGGYYVLPQNDGRVDEQYAYAAQTWTA